MFKSAFLFGGIWAATATSVALIRSPYSGEEFEVETLDSKDFPVVEGKIPFVTKYLNYFASSKEVNKKFWEARFNEKRGDNKKIDVAGYSENNIEIVSGWDEPTENKSGRFSLVRFCRENYSVSSNFDGNQEWGFIQSDDPYWDRRHFQLWSLCSVFGSKPVVLFDKESSDHDQDATYPRLVQIRDKSQYQLVQADTPHPFWDIREREWQDTDVKDSKYFGNEKKGNHSIRELCRLAYSKTPAESNDTVDAPTQDAAVKYCGLEWTRNS